MAKLIYQYSRLLIIFIITLPLIGCSTISYYSQSIHGQFEVIQKSKPISELLKNESLPDGYQKKLNTVLELREFSVKELGLPNNDSYTSFADLERDYVIWNIFANPEFSLQPLSWCYFIVGCLSYRGYFSKEDAEQYEIQLKQQGYDTYLGGVAAYSTLGWFDDPVLNSMLRWNENYLATVMFHELAHQQVYIKNDTELNESYADAVAHIGVTRWLKKKTDNKYLLKYEQAQQQEKVFIDLINHYKLKLDQLYQSSDEDQIKRKHKKVILAEMQNEYAQISQKWQSNPYKKWFSNGLNNAKLASVITYRKYVPAFLEVFEKLNRDLNAFYSYSNSLSNCKQLKRRDILKRRSIEFEC